MDICLESLKSNKEQYGWNLFDLIRENPRQPNLVLGVMIQRIECPVKLNQWSYSTPEQHQAAEIEVPVDLEAPSTP